MQAAIPTQLWPRHKRGNTLRAEYSKSETWPVKALGIVHQCATPILEYIALPPLPLQLVHCLQNIVLFYPNM